MDFQLCLHAAQVAALAPPDETEMEALGMELLALEAAMADCQILLHAKGCNTQTADEAIKTQTSAEATAAPSANGLSAVSPSAARPTAQRQQGGSAEQQLHLPLGHMPGAHAFLCDTDNSLTAIDAVMQARGYR